MTVTGYLDFMASIRGVDAATRQERVPRCASSAASTTCDTLIHKLSRGYRQRVGLAQAIVHDPPVLILDEPTVGLDPKQIIDTRALIKSLAEDRAVILSTHILPEVSMTCSRVVIINQGEVLAEDTPDRLAASLRGAERVELVARGPAAAMKKALTALQDVERVEQTGKTRGSSSHRGLPGGLDARPPWPPPSCRAVGL